VGNRENSIDVYGDGIGFLIKKAPEKPGALTNQQLL